MPKIKSKQKKILKKRPKLAKKDEKLMLLKKFQEAIRMCERYEEGENFRRSIQSIT